MAILKGGEKMKSLYELSENYLEILAQCDEDNAEIADALNAVESDIEDKVKNGIGLIQTLKRRAENYDAEIKRLSTLKKATENNLERIQNNYLDNLRRIGKSKVVTPIGAMAVVKSGGKRKMVIDDEELVPADFKFTKTVDFIDKDALRDSLENGEIVDGAHLEERGNYLRIS